MTTTTADSEGSRPTGGEQATRDTLSASRAARGEGAERKKLRPQAGWTRRRRTMGKSNEDTTGTAAEHEAQRRSSCANREAKPGNNGVVLLSQLAIRPEILCVSSSVSINQISVDFFRRDTQGGCRWAGSKAPQWTGGESGATSSSHTLSIV
jgi:hypothetical protein